MQTDLFLAQPEDLNLLPIDGAVHNYGVVLTASEADSFFARLKREIAWAPDTAMVNGELIQSARQVAWHADSPLSYTHSGVQRQSLPWDKTVLSELRNVVQRATATRFNSCVLNLYQNGSQGMGWHSDPEAQGLHDVIASLSFGATRKFAFKHKASGERRDLALHHGQLIVMRGETQKYWLHALQRTSLEVGPRVSLTFRQFPDVSSVSSSATALGS
ncbi:alpha-ketoglutarate-dependent dioxygenase AlkB [Pseudomonas sp. GV071]|uniref:alpha-ketoglutarate-dependent dioxygenase AlkB family protein n=1 Tax=Pseudomonas sp. GV071 TaxID=2135754 RepID=UPI000D377833|nr:alpha-ketoglutarate-dependent dioxygenase AlkB [Pseudomonas sp. GV071]PTQ74318.1 alkylated DNA repair dioxygenase AlkB [Pseudomonas sp. GV071]